MSLQGKKIILGITGSIAAYKSVFLTRLLIKAGAEVQVIMTPAAASFVTPLTFSTISKNPVHTDIFDDNGWNNHVELGLWADVFIIAPATANTMGKMATGMADNLLLATYLSAKCPVLVAPAMDLDMWKHGSTQHNLSTLQSYGDTIIPVNHGELASGLVGAGRMAEPEEILDFVIDFLTVPQDLAGKQVMITAGPTHEFLDPVRYIGNRSTGKMGIALAEECSNRGAQVNLILGPTKEQIEHPHIQVHNVVSAAEMYEVSERLFKAADIAIMAAAVADYTPENRSDVKMKKQDDDLALPLKRTIDIAKTLGQKKGDTLLVGFALETDNARENAQEKLTKKNFDLIVLNTLEDAGAGFGHDTNKVTVFNKFGESRSYPLKSKKAVALDIVNEILTLLNRNEKN